MPQLDKVTFLTQFTYLVVTFFGFYLFLIKHFLPNLSTLLKIRQERLKIQDNSNLNSSINLVGQESSLLVSHENLFQKAQQCSRSSIQNALQSTQVWQHQHNVELRTGTLGPVHKAYLTTLSSHLRAQQVLQYVQLKTVLTPVSQTKANFHVPAGLLKQKRLSQSLLAHLDARNLDKSVKISEADRKTGTQKPFVLVQGPLPRKA